MCVYLVAALYLTRNTYILGYLYSKEIALCVTVYKNIIFKVQYTLIIKVFAGECAFIKHMCIVIYYYNMYLFLL